MLKLKGFGFGDGGRLPRRRRRARMKLEPRLNVLEGGICHAMSA